MKLILASTSKYRAELLTRLAIPFEQRSPEVDETPRDDESPKALAIRLASAKAMAVASKCQEISLVIGSDQVATIDGIQPIGKPGNHERAVAQLQKASGRACTFHTAMAVVNSNNSHQLNECVDTVVTFRELNVETIEHYLRTEQPYDCAGAAKSEGLGIALLRSIRGDDPTALVGLPLITLTALLAEMGLPALIGQGR
jgi:septum formation protein